MDIDKEFVIPDNIRDWIRQRDGVNLAINYNSASADYGYAHIIHHSVVISMLNRHCNNCDYDELWSPNDENSKCARHTYSKAKYEPIFVWSPKGNLLSLEMCFSIFAKKYESRKWNEAVQYMGFGELGWT